LLHAVGLHPLSVSDGGPERRPVVVDGRLQVVHGDGHVVDLGEQGATGSGCARRAHWPCRRNSVIRSSPILARASGSSIPRPSEGAKHSTPTLPSCRLWCTSRVASPTCSRGCTVER